MVEGHCAEYRECAKAQDNGQPPQIFRRFVQWLCLTPAPVFFVSSRGLTSIDPRVNIRVLLGNLDHVVNERSADFLEPVRHAIRYYNNVAFGYAPLFTAGKGLGPRLAGSRCARVGR